MFRKYEEEYNPKIDFKLIYSINPYLNINENYKEIRNYFHHKTKVESKQATMFKNLKEIFDFLKTKLIKTLTKKEIKQITKQLETQDIEEDKIDSLLALLQNEKKDDIPTFSTKVFEFIIKNEIFKEISFEIGLLFMNAILYQNHYIPVVIFRNNFDFFKTLIKQNVTTTSLVDIFANLEDVSMRYKEKFEQTTKQNIINVLFQNKWEMNQRFQVEKLWLYGSFVRDDTTPYSDVDLFVQMKDESRKDELRNYLFEKLKRPVDIQVEGHYHPNFSMKPALVERELIFDVSQ